MTLGLALAGWCSTAVIAADEPTVNDLPDACKADVEKFCSNVKLGEGRVKACLKEHRFELSSECKKAARGKSN
jgi:hypothetical protein